MIVFSETRGEFEVDGGRKDGVDVFCRCSERPAKNRLPPIFPSNGLLGIGGRNRALGYFQQRATPRLMHGIQFTLPESFFLLGATG